MIKKFEKAVDDLLNRHPLIHCITNPISINQCASTLLAVGARPVMAEHPSEVYEITQTASALLLNLGNITDVRMQAMKISASAAAESYIPTVIDLVGISCSQLRRDFALELLDNNKIAVIKGNYSEIQALYNLNYRSTGVDSANDISAEKMCEINIELSKKYNALILASGKTDVIAFDGKLVCMSNGTAQLSKITGSGCMLGALCAAYISVTDVLSAVCLACAVLGISAETASENFCGNASFLTALIDNISLTDIAKIISNIKAEEKNYD